MAMSGCLWELIVSLSAFPSSLRMRTAYRSDLTSSSSSSFLTFSNLISLSHLTSFSSISFSNCYFIDLYI
jgi:hypothetical protein